ncbi:caspase domain-containing protein [Cercophora scortea]|uniref:Caspase domain-containing protein n=1 Tax=Cercophora scortea TaxID=314031 RepID=A0AAE0I2J8_9PEZI|nr:caspase domain-containing protein [Cercophora scortea]
MIHHSNSSQSQIMISQKRALLIGSPYGGLRGPSNDVDKMTAVLGAMGFAISKCCGIQATRDGIIHAWRDLIHETSQGDVVVVYYSGHGGLVEAPQITADLHEPWRYQFLVPIDYDNRSERGFNGILDVELSLLLREATDKTRNVTVVLDCCHSGRMSRNPSYGNRAVPRQLPEVCHQDISTYLETLMQTHQLKGKPYLEGNPYAVRIAAAATSETAWERESPGGSCAGAMTEALCRALQESREQEVSWRTTMIRVSELVGLEFPEQHPQVEGPSTRLQFSLEHASSGALAIQVHDGIGLIQAGRVAGVRVGNVYSVMPFGTDVPRADAQIGTATVTIAGSFKARAQLTYNPGRSVPKEGALAFLQKEALTRWPVACTPQIPSLLVAIDNSPYLRRLDQGEEGETPLLYIEQINQSVCLLTGQRVLLASREVDTPTATASYTKLIQAAETKAKAHHLQTLQCGDTRDKLFHSLSVEFGTVESGAGLNDGRIIRQDGSDFLTDHDRAYISLTNRAAGGPESTIYVSVFDINVAGEIFLICHSYPKGIDLPPQRNYVLGEDAELHLLDGLRMSWPDSVSREQPVSEELVLVITSSPVDLSALSSGDSPGDQERRNARRSALNNLELLGQQIAKGTTRNVESDRSVSVKYDVLHIPFTLVSSTLSEPDLTNERGLTALPWPMEVSTGKDGGILASDLPPPEATPGWGMLSQSGVWVVPKGKLGAMKRWFQGIPPCVKVTNEHDEPITVVVSKYRPNRMFSGGGVNLSSTGGGVDFTTTVSSLLCNVLPSSTYHVLRGIIRGCYPKLWCTNRMNETPTRRSPRPPLARSCRQRRMKGGEWASSRCGRETKASASLRSLRERRTSRTSRTIRSRLVLLLSLRILQTCVFWTSAWAMQTFTLERCRSGHNWASEKVSGPQACI